MIQYLTIVQKSLVEKLFRYSFPYWVTNCNSFDSYTQDDVNLTF